MTMPEPDKQGDYHLPRGIDIRVRDHGWEVVMGPWSLTATDDGSTLIFDSPNEAAEYLNMFNGETTDALEP